MSDERDLRDAVIYLADSLNAVLAVLGNLDPGRDLSIEYEQVAEARRIANTVPR